MRKTFFWLMLAIGIMMAGAGTSCSEDDNSEAKTKVFNPDSTTTTKPDSTLSATQGWPANYGGVMLQGFYWNSFEDSQWAVLEQQADQLSGTFDLVWLPQSGNCGGLSMGYDDLYWFENYNSSFGNEQQLRSLINTFKTKNIKTIADVVINHRRNLSSWVDFPKEVYKGVTYEMQSTDIVANDDDGKTKQWATQNGYELSGRNDSGEGWSGMRDLDHNSENVQTIVKAYLDFLINDLGYAGFRYDMVKGYSASFTGKYNSASQPEFSVGECWDGSNRIKSWIDGTKVDNQPTSAAFDFQFRYVVRNAMNSGNYARLAEQNDNNWPLISSNFSNGNYRRYAVTFVENHDTERRSDSAQDPLTKDTLAANAYMLAMPGTPCVFLKHWQAYKQEIANMVAVRKAVGITNESKPTQIEAKQDYYAVQVEGSGAKKLLCVVGSKATTYTPDANWKKVLSGYHYIYYVQGITPEDITLPVLPQDIEPQPDGEFAGIPSFCKVSDGEICAFFESPSSWGSQIFTWAWMNGGDGKDYVGTSWPGVEATQIGTADNGNKVFKWISSQTTAPDNIIFSGLQQTADLQFQNGGYYTKDGLQGTVSAK